jgi:serine/threonine protein kinase
MLRCCEIIIAVFVECCRCCQAVVKRLTRQVWLERNVMVHCRSPFIVPLEAAFQDPHHLFLVMPFYGGGDLDELLKKLASDNASDVADGIEPALPGMELDHARFFFVEMILALQHLHRYNICHRDIKPGNIFVATDGHLVLGDFGLAKKLLRDDAGRFTERSLRWGECGSYGYRAPEVIEDRLCSFPGDVWSLGITFYEMLHLCLPWKSTADHLAGQPLEFHHAIPAEVVDLLR